jgi:dolichol-phosphate mannosyltransferase
MRVLVVVPTYNERENVEILVPAVRATIPLADVLVVDDDSPDGTGVVAARLADRLGQIDVIHRPGKQGLGSAYRAGFEYGLDRGYDVIVSMDVDLSHDPEVLPELLGLIDAGADAVIGSRYVPGGATANWPWHRRVLSRWGNRYTSFILRLQVRDCTSGYRAYRAAALKEIDPGTTTAEGYAFLTELVRRLVRADLRVMETPIVFRDRRYGTSKMSGRIVAESMWLVTTWAIRDVVRHGIAANEP